MTKKRSGSRHEHDGQSPVLTINTELSASGTGGGGSGGAPPPSVLVLPTAAAAAPSSAPASAVTSPASRLSNSSNAANSPRMFYPKQMRSSNALRRSGSFSSGSSSLASSPVAGGAISTAHSVAVALLSKNMQSKAEFKGMKGEVFSLGEIYLNDLSDIRVFEFVNLKSRRVQLLLTMELRKPFQASQWGFQLENENMELMDGQLSDSMPVEEFNHVPFSVLRPSSKAALCAENVYLCEGYNELFNHIGTVDELILEPNETKRVVFSLCAKLSPQHSNNNAGHSSSYTENADSSEEERMHLNQTSCAMLTGRLIVKPRYLDRAVSSENLKEMRTTVLPAPDVIIPLQGQVCRSLLRLDVKELHFDDCVPGGSFVKDFTVWNRSEIPLLFKLVSSLSAFDETKDLITCTDYNTGYVIENKTLQAAAYGHVRIRVTYRPQEVGERFFEIHAQNLHDSRNVKILRIHAITNKEHHREGLSIKEPNGSYLMSGSKLDFGDCYTGLANSKVLLIRNTTEATLHVDLTSDRPKEISFELKLQQNRARSSRAPRGEEVLSPTGSNGSSRKGSLSSDGAKAALSFSNIDANYGLDSDEEAEENEIEFYEDDFLPTKRLSFEENQMGDLEDIDDDFEFDREPRPMPRSSPVSPKSRISRQSESRKKAFRTKGKKSAKVPSRVRDLAYESGVDSGNSMCSSPERKPRSDLRKRQPASIDEATGSNFLVETIDLPPGVERTILIWYTPSSSSSLESLLNENMDGIDLKGSRLTKQTFRVSFRCFQIQGSWQQAQSRVYDRSLGKSIHIRARTCTSIVTVTPSILHLGDCNIGELKSSSCILTNHSELPTVVKPLVTSKVISTVPNDEMTLGPKQSTELKIEIIPRKTNPNYSRLISVMNLKNRTNIPQICIRSSNMDAHHVIYHSLFYKLLTQSKSAFLNFDHIAVNSVGIQVFDLENITNAPLHLNLQSSDPSKVRLYCFKISYGDVGTKTGAKTHDETQKLANGQIVSGEKHAGNSVGGSSSHSRHHGRPIRRRRSFGSLSELGSAPSSSKRNMSSVLRGYLSKKLTTHSPSPSSHQTGGSAFSVANLVISPAPSDSIKLRSDPTPSSSVAQSTALTTSNYQDGTTVIGTSGATSNHLPSFSKESLSEELVSLLRLFEMSRAECERYCQSTLPSHEKEVEIVGMVRERMRKLQSLLAEKMLIPLNNSKDRNIRIPAKSQQRVVAIFSPSIDFAAAENGGKIRIEKQKIFITLPPGGNKKAVADAARFDQTKATWVTSKHPFDSRPSVRELLLKSRVCRSVMNVNQKNINFGRITTSSKSSKKLVVQNMSAIPLVYSVEKTGSISSGFLEIKEGEVGVVKAFGTKEICFEFQPTLAGPFEEKLRIVNVQDVENSISVTIKAKVVKRETFKLVQSGQVLSFGKCLVGEKSEEVKIVVRNTSRKKREYVIQLDPEFSNPNLRPTFHFSLDETPSAIITQAQEKKLDEELEKLEHKLRIATTKKKADKIVKLNAKISRAKALLSGEQVPSEKESLGDEELKGTVNDSRIIDAYDSNSESEFSESESTPRLRRRQKLLTKSQSLSDTRSNTNQLHFSLDAEATGRIVAYVIFNTIQQGSESVKDGEHREVGKVTGFRSQKARKKQLRRDSTPVTGVGKFLLFEQQNKDVMKELQYSAEIFLRTAAGETAYSRAVGRKVLPPFAHSGTISRGVPRTSLEIGDTAQDATSLGASGTEHTSTLVSAKTDQQNADQKRDLTIAIPDDSGFDTGRVLVKVEPNQFAISHSSTLLIPLEEFPVDTYGWSVTLSHQSPVLKKVSDVEVFWRPSDVIRSLIGISCDVTPGDALLNEDASMEFRTSEDKPHCNMLPTKVRLTGDRAVTLHFKWCFTAEAGFGSSSSLGSCINRSILGSISKAMEQNAGKLEFYYRGNSSPSSANSTSTLPTRPIASVDVAIVKAVQRSLCLDAEKIDLGVHQQGSEAQGEFIIRNRSHQPTKYLLMAATSREQSNGQGTLSVGGDITFESPTGSIEANSQVAARFTYKGAVPGQHNEQIQLRNLNDRLDTSILTVAVRVTRPVYVRVPELDLHATGQLDVLDLGPCYVTPEMQDTAVDSPNVSLKFSKVHKLTLHSQVDETLVICASSNLRTQCYVFEDARLSREATHVVLKGKQSTDLFVAFRPRLSSDAFKTGSTRDLVGGIRVQLYLLSSEPPTPSTEDEKSEMVAEFTVKFVGVAGASLARVSPYAIDFGVEHNPGGMQPPIAHEGKFDLINVSKALPLRYRLFVTTDGESYSDDDCSLQIELDHEKGEVPPGETSSIGFKVTAQKNGLFRRRILVENLHYPGKINYVDVVLFVDSGSLKCDVFGSSKESSPSDQLQTMDFGVINVIKLEEELADNASSVAGGETEPTSRKYRIFEERHDGLYSAVNGDNAGGDLVEASTLKVINVNGEYGESCIQVSEKYISLGKIGYAIGWKSSSFELSVRNTSDVDVWFAIANLPSCIHIRNVRDASQASFEGENVVAPCDNQEVPSLRSLALQVESKSANGPCRAWKLDAMTTCVMEMEFVRTRESLSAGVHDFPLRFLNLDNPHNVEDVSVRAHIISSYAELAVDPESSHFGGATGSREHVALLPPVTVPPAQEASPQGSSFWFSLRNVYDEDLSVKLSSEPHSSLESTLELLMFSRSANTPLSTLQIAPGDSVDVRVVCHVFPSARLSPDVLKLLEYEAGGDILDLGSVWLDVSVQNALETAQKKHIGVKGKLIPGRTFTLSASSLHFFATATEVPSDIPVEQLPPSLKSKAGSSRESVQLALTGSSQQASPIVHQLRNISETFYVRNPSTVQPLNFVIEPVPMFQPGLCLIKGSTASEMSAMSEYIEAVAVPSSGTIAPGDSMKISVRLEEASLIAAAESAHYHGSGDNAKAVSLLHKMRHHPSWRSNSWGAEAPDIAAEVDAQNHMFLKVRDVDLNADVGVSTEIDVHLVLQQNAPGSVPSTDGSKQGGVVDKALIGAAFAAREKRLTSTSKKSFAAPALSTHMEDSTREDNDYAGLDNLDEFDVGSINSESHERKNHLPVLTVRGCTPAENSSLESIRYIIDVGQHTVRNGGEVEWEITVECLYSQIAAQEGGGLDPVDYKFTLVDQNAKSWLQLSRDRGTLDRSRSYQSAVLYFLRDVVGVYSTFMVLQNVTNPSDLKVIHVRLEVIADLNSLRSMSSGLDPTTNLFRVLVSNHGNPKRQRRSSIELPSGNGSESPRGSGNRSGLVIDYSEVYYHKLYHNHSIVLENSSGLTLDFMLSSNARPQEVSFSTSPTSFTEVSTVTLGAHARMQVFLHFRPQPRPVSSSTSDLNTAGIEHWVREIEVYVNCRLVKDFRETVVLRAICNQPQLLVNVATSKTDDILSKTEASGVFPSSQPNFLGAVFAMPEVALSNPELAATLASEADKFIVVHNTRSDAKARLALRNDSMFFNVGVDVMLTAPVVFRITPDVASLWKHHQLWDHSVKEHITLYNIKQFAEHYQVTLCFTCSNVSSFYIPPNISESYPFSALEDTIAKFLQNYNYTWKALVTYHGKTPETEMSTKTSTQTTSLSASKLVEILSDLENALELSSPLSPRRLHPTTPQDFESTPTRFDGFSSGENREVLHQLLQSYRALYFDFYYITDELVWYGVRGNAVRHSLMLADLAYGVVFNHEVFRGLLAPNNDTMVEGFVFPRLLLPWIRQLGHFLSFFPENQETTMPLRQMYDQLRKFELA
uniref:MSP domain-containing protein n=1 Tax=Globisporangium ultimum (strain ATCC 200006 / CBS 805.95 / DAOM BR144) TaxID=431595 RepID=K3WPU0_GLOUD